MKKLFTFILISSATLTQAQDFKGLDKSPMDRVFYPPSSRVSDKAIVITYSRPQLRGRDLDVLVPLNKLWRTGSQRSY